MPDHSQKQDVTIYDIAEALGVSPSTVSRSLKEHPSISKETIRKVRKQAKKMGYRSNIFAQNLRRQKTNIIGVIVPRLNSHFMSSAISGMEKVANKNHYKIIISQSHEQAVNEASNVEMMLEQRVDGLIVSLAYNTMDLHHFDAITEQHTPLIFFDRVADLPNSTNVVIDNYQAAYKMTNHLIDEGCSRIVHITGNTSRNVYSGRLKGYKEALLEHQLSYDSDLVFINDLREEDGEQVARKILEMDQLPDAVFASNDVCAVSCMALLQEHGIEIPRDIAIAGFNNDPISRFVKPKITTVDYDGERVGEVVAQNLINHLEGDDHISITNTIVLNSDLIIRDSSRKQDAG
ncbi:LacI family DNA-binding transcriptional regulator [Fodinibius sediminis]|uniref:Transcriptional regulator, LacI family n=1 Tax=Fodinibius sediminis TaxID=1214077 RepID=A0A521B229_9BACT|nr:LacI family DNA-binding transcriptional regulator [Fodinibius sediminis]SMO41153.1 transcriptional regulator, LacI family [Fodinibius sediminis]